ncbi:MAG: class II glutamine amidotransferase [Deltaproteobacteria bacterium]|nr:class II glutamine amidotransferase [Deltaproteobacteria bacterium]
MCRLFGFHALREHRVHAALVSEANCLKKQSHEHPDGWGVAAWGTDGQPALSFSLSPAHADEAFDRVATGLYAKTVLAHIRLASVGGIRLPNTHPFRFGRWCFAHNGTVTAFSDVKARVEAEIAPRFRALIAGDTDSERCCALFLTYLSAEVDLDGPVPLLPVAWAAARTSRRVAELSDTPEKPSSLNFLVSDGRVMVATRRHRPLHLVSRPDAFFVASEKLCDARPWEEVPNFHMVGVGSDMALHRWETDALGAG